MDEQLSCDDSMLIAEHFYELDTLLAEHRQYWQLRAFEVFDPLWPDALIASLALVAEDDLAGMDADQDKLIALLSVHLPVAKRLQVLCEAIPFASSPAAHDERLGVGLPGRKWAQIKSFANLVPKSSESVLEWCAGKGHLGRLHACSSHQPVTSLEWDQRLCDQGVLSARKHDAKQRFVCQDALSTSAADLIPLRGSSIALHACGDLHGALINAWASRRAQHLLVAPCCYHLTANASYQPFSQLARGGQVRLSKADLSLPLQATVTGGARAHRLRDQEILWRLSFDLLQRHIRGIEQYLPLPNFQKKMLSGRFDEFIAWAFAAKTLSLPANIDLTHWLSLGRQRLLQVRRIELVGKLFHRALELWLVLDRAIYLQEQGAHVEVVRFCDYKITPRNFAISASFDAEVEIG